MNHKQYQQKRDQILADLSGVDQDAFEKCDEAKTQIDNLIVELINHSKKYSLHDENGKLQSYLLTANLRNIVKGDK